MESFQENWQYKPRNYLHFDLKLSEKDAIELVTSSEQVALHSFWPFIHFEKKVLRYKKTEQKNELGKSVRKISEKTRDLYYAAHSDSAIYSYYSYLLMLKHEELLMKESLSDSIIAYRKFPEKKCNIHFANEAFLQIGQNGNNVAIGFDIEGFFDNLDHQVLKEQWLNLLNLKLLPIDHYAIFKSVTKFAYVNRNEVYSILGISQRYRLKIPRLCSPLDFRKKIVNLIKTNRDPNGIIQGSPISALLSNIYMIPFDINVYKKCQEFGAVYRRYSDDILIICKPEHREELIKLVKEEIQKRKLTINDAKTVCSIYSTTNKGFQADKPFQYLGFTFDGHRRLVRSQTLGKFYRRMKQSVRSAERAAKAACKKGGRRKLYRNQLFKKFTMLGPKKKDQECFKMSFPIYIDKAIKVTNNITGNENQGMSIKRQFNSHQTILTSLLKKADNS